MQTESNLVYVGILIQTSVHWNSSLNWFGSDLHWIPIYTVYNAYHDDGHLLFCIVVSKFYNHGLI